MCQANARGGPAESSPMRRGLKAVAVWRAEHAHEARRIFPDEEGTERNPAFCPILAHWIRRIFPDEEGTERRFS